MLHELDERHQAISDNDENSYEKLTAEMGFLKSFINNFFSSNGSANDIRKMYIAIDTDANKDKTCECVNLCDISPIYKEYLRGMIEFINDTNKINDNVAFNDYHDKFIKANENDLKFIESLFDGKISGIKTINLPEASMNLEYLIELIPFMDAICVKCKNLEDSIYTSTNKDKTELINNCIKMLYNSIRTYCFLAVKNIISTYIKINDLLKDDEVTAVSGFRLY